MILLIFLGLKHENNPKLFNSQNNLIILVTIQPFYLMFS
jgi:hypothetical protein